MILWRHIGNYPLVLQVFPPDTGSGGSCSLLSSKLFWTENESPHQVYVTVGVRMLLFTQRLKCHLWERKLKEAGQLTFLRKVKSSDALVRISAHCPITFVPWHGLLPTLFHGKQNTEHCSPIVHVQHSLAHKQYCKGIIWKNHQK